MDRSKKKLQLPKSVLDMKFMKKTKERIEKEIENTHDHENLYANIITDEMRAAPGNFISESSFIFCEDLLEGRLSFKGMNPEIERLMQADAKEEPADNGEMEKDISDEILAKKMEIFHKRKRESKKPNRFANNKKRNLKHKFKSSKALIWLQQFVNAYACCNGIYLETVTFSIDSLVIDAIHGFFSQPGKTTSEYDDSVGNFVH